MVCALAWFSSEVEGVLMDEEQSSMFVSLVFDWRDEKMDAN